MLQSPSGSKTLPIGKERLRISINRYLGDWPLNKTCQTNIGVQVPNVVLKPNKEGLVHLFPLSDVHIGQESHNQDLFEQTLQHADAVEGYFILGGDMFEVAVPTHIPHASWDQTLTTDDQFLKGLKYFRNRADRVIFSTSGNHDARVWKKAGFDMARQFATDLGCFYNKNGGYIKVRVGTQEYTLAIFHGHSAGTNPFTELERRLSVYQDADIIMMGHNHQLCYKASVKKRIVDGEEKRQVIYLVRTGSFLNEPEYSREALYSPTLEGSPIIQLGGKTRYINVDVLGEGRWV